MQPYLFPYLGYFQLINAVDTFLLYSYVQHIKRGWINRNYILINGSAHLFTFSIDNPSVSRTIKQTYYAGSLKEELIKFVRKLNLSYRRAPFYDETMRVINKISSYEEHNVSEYNCYSIQQLCTHLNIKSNVIEQPSVEDDTTDKFSRILSICNAHNSNDYVNAIGGKEIYNKEQFERNGLSLRFLRSKIDEYKQFGDTFVPNLSIIDVLMFNGAVGTKRLLSDYVFE
jgi:hypothetical protein